MGDGASGTGSFSRFSPPPHPNTWRRWAVVGALVLAKCKGALLRNLRWVLVL